MNETHLEQPELRTALDEITEAVRDLDTEQELRQTALEMAITVFLDPGNKRYTDIIGLAEGFYRFLSSDDDEPED